MRKKIEILLDDYGLKRGRGYNYLAETTALYETDSKLKDIYAIVASREETTAAAVEKSIAACVSELALDPLPTPKEFIAAVKERILFDFDE